MPKFKDTEGREWSVEITTATLRKLRDEANGFKLDDIMPREPTAKDDGEKQALVDRYSEFVNDDLRFAEVLWVIVKPQANAAGVTQEQFEQALDGAANQRAVDAFHGAFADFSMGHCQSRAMVLKSFTVMMEKKGKVMTLGQKRIDAEGAKLDDGKLESFINNAADQAGKEFDSALSKLAGNSGATSA